jgi:hypothetical protein
LLKTVINAFELGGKKVLFGSEDVGIVGFGIGPHKLLRIIDRLLEEMDLLSAGGHFIGSGLVVEEGIGDFLACGEDGLFEGEEIFLLLAFGHFETLTVKTVLENRLGEAADDTTE